MKKKLKFNITFILITLVRLLLTNTLPVYYISQRIYDDQLMISQAKEIVSGNWLGNYNHLTLVKGFFYPFYLSLSNFLGISYTTLLTISFIGISILFMYSIKKYFK